LQAKASASSAVIVSATSSTGSAPSSATTAPRTEPSASRSRETSNGRETVRPASPLRHTAFVLAPPTSSPITPGIRDASRPCE
jgi:hypothetical protein